LRSFFFILSLWSINFCSNFSYLPYRSLTSAFKLEISEVLAFDFSGFSTFFSAFDFAAFFGAATGMLSETIFLQNPRIFSLYFSRSSEVAFSSCLKSKV